MSGSAHGNQYLPEGAAWPRIECAAVVGAGSWGTAFARHLALRGVRTVLLARRPEHARAMASLRRNPDYLRTVPLPPSLEVGTYVDFDFSACDLVVLAVPSRAYAEVVQSLAPQVSRGVGVLSLTKGLEPGTWRRLSVVAAEILAGAAPRIAVLSGPNHAEEVSLELPTATVIASTDLDFARTLQALVSNETFRAYVNPDVIGVEIAATVKNIIAIATGMADGLGFGDNTRATLVTRGLAEMARLGRALGAKESTFVGLAGLGDLVVTCTSRHSRNRLAGELLAKGHSPVEIELETGMVAEGLTAASAVRGLARSLECSMPITENVAAVIYEGKDVRQAARDLMVREPKAE